MRNVVIFLLVISLAVFSAGCVKAPAEKIVARINNYELTAEDFAGEARLTMGNKNLSRDDSRAKEELLDEMITKKILLQEAQQQNFDKDRAFMKEIERYWEQALLKLLIKKKTAEFEQTFARDAIDARREKIRKALDKWMSDLRRRARIIVDKQALDSIDVGGGKR